MSTATAPLTIEQFAQLPEAETQGCELVQGEIVPMGNAASGHEVVKANFIDDLTAYNRQHPIGKVFSETAYALRPSDTRMPDVSLLLAHRLPPPNPAKLFQGAPELAVEVVSSETAAQLESKVTLYLETGARAVWVAFPEQHTIWRHRSDGTVQRLKEGDYLEEPDLLPGFRVPVSRFFEGI